MVVRKEHFSKLQASYLFVNIAQKRKAFVDANPDKKLISLGIGDTTQPLPESICAGLTNAAKGLGTQAGYSGYPDWNGGAALREAISKEFYNGLVSPDEVILSDGSKPDLCRMQALFGDGVNIAVQDPVYPAYVDGSVIAGKTGKGIPESSGRYEGITYMECNPENSFFPDLEKLEKKSYVLFFCSPNNPTGATATKEQLTKLVAFAKETQSIIVFDTAYRAFITDDSLPRSIYEIEGAREVAMETSSFSKLVGFTGVRLGWTVCPTDVKYETGESVFDDWKRIMGTYFNGPSNIAEAGGLAAMQPAGMKEMSGLVSYYMQNAKTLRDVIVKKHGFEAFGGDHSPYLWVKAPTGKTSWDMFDLMLKECAIVITPGVGFGSQGEGYVRFSCFASHESVAEAAGRIDDFFTKYMADPAAFAGA